MERCRSFRVRHGCRKVLRQKFANHLCVATFCSLDEAQLACAECASRQKTGEENSLGKSHLAKVYYTGECFARYNNRGFPMSGHTITVVAAFVILACPSA